MNAFGCRYLGVRCDDARGDAWHGLIHPDDLPALMRQWTSAMAQGNEFSAEYRVRRADGLYRWNVGRSLPLRDPDTGAIVRWIGTLTDIEDAKRRAIELAEAKRQSDELATLLNTIQTAAPVGFAFLSPDFRYLRINDSLAAMNGIPVSEHLGRTVEEVLPSIWSTVRPMLERVRDGQPVTNLEIVGEVPARPGERRHWLASYYPIHVAGEFIGIGTLTVETTEQHRLQEQLQHSQKMEAVGRLAGSVAHDFNNLLTVIVGNAELLLGDFKDPEYLTQSLRDIQDAGKAAAAITTQLLTFSRRQVVGSAVLDVHEALESMMRLIEQAAGEQVTLRTALAERLSNVRIDKSRFQQVLLNLVVNAKDAMPKGGELTIECRDVTVDAASGDEPGREAPKPGRYVLLSVSDTGTGMTADVRAKLFEPFFTTKPAGRGTGLGLSTVYGIVTQAGGHIAVYSEPGRGSSFKVYVPAVAEDVTDTIPADAAPGSLQGTETILLVEDEDAVRRFARDVLMRNGYTVLDAATADEAVMLESRYSGQIHLLVTDVALPRADGREVAQAVAARRATTRVLFMSGYAAAAVAGNTLVPGKNFLTKPFGPTELLFAVRQALTVVN